MRRPIDVIFLGPYPPPVNGQSVAFKFAHDQYNGTKKLCDQNLEQLPFYKKIFFALKLIFTYIFLSTSRKYSVLYLAGSRSVGGALKDVFSILFFHFTGSRIVLHIHAAFFNHFISSLPFYLKPLFTLAYHRVDRFIVLHESMKGEYNGFLPEAQVSVLHNFYDPILDELEIKDKPNSEVIKIGYFSNLIYSKGIFILLEAFRELKKEYEHIELHIAGQYYSDQFMNERTVRERLNTFIKDPKDGIFYHGPLYGMQKKDFLKALDIFVLPSFYASEAMPISIIEAMRSGCVIIATEHHYLPFLVGPDQGACAKVRSVVSLKENLTKYIEQKDLRDQVKRANIEFAKKNYSPENFASGINTILELELKEFNV
ncbi:MAG: glycosyltransferase family 4 protein [Saprospiraceae bacterium]|nr:glycosyltransferase family 4 protein [Candidatus Vicinibacter affinis]